MRILHSQRIVLVSKPRSGSTSLRVSLDAYLHPGDVSCDRPYGQWHPHHTALRLKQIFERKGWNFASYYKFCTSRNPYDLLVSYYEYFRPDGTGTYNYQMGHDRASLMAFKRWVMEGTIWDQTEQRLGRDLGTIGIGPFCFDSRGTQLVDRIFDLEQVDHLQKELADRLGDSDFSVLHTNMSNRKDTHYREYYDRSTRRRVERMFPLEFELFDYRF